jgi:DNA-binding IclR family transcriptional regulator
MDRPAIAATRAVAVLNFLAANSRQQYSHSDLATHLEINLASTHAVLGAPAE